MGNTECLVFVRALRPFKVRKYRLERHPNYRYLAEADRGYLQKNAFVLTYDDAEMEAVRVKPVGEEGYVAPAVVDSARRRAREQEKRRRAEREEKEKAKDRLLESDETKSKRQMERDRRGRENLPGLDDGEKLREAALDGLQLVDDFDPAYEFEVVEAG